MAMPCPKPNEESINALGLIDFKVDFPCDMHY